MNTRLVAPQTLTEFFEAHFLIKSFLRAVLPGPVLNFVRRWRILLQTKTGDASTSTDYWTGHHVPAPDEGFASIEASLAHYDKRNNQYPGTLELTPVDQASGKCILDYGCGPGNDVIGFGTYSRPEKLVACDVSPVAIELARKRAALHKLDVEFFNINENDSRLPFDAGSFDLIHTAGVLHHTPDPLAILKEFHRVLRPDGYVQIMVYNRDSLWMHLHVAHEIMIELGLYKDLSKEDAFRHTTDGPNCPIAMCFRPPEFIEMARQAGFDCHFQGAGISTLELNLLPSLDKALQDERLDEESREFLSSLTFDDQGRPLVHGQVAGVNGCYRLVPVSG